MSGEYESAASAIGGLKASLKHVLEQLKARDQWDREQSDRRHEAELERVQQMGALMKAVERAETEATTAKTEIGKLEERLLRLEATATGPNVTVAEAKSRELHSRAGFWTAVGTAIAAVGAAIAAWLTK